MQKHTHQEFIRFLNAVEREVPAGKARLVDIRGCRRSHVEMQFTKRLRDPIMRGEITCSVRIWQRPRVKVGGFYALGSGAVEVTALRQIELDDITPALARRSGFAGVIDLLKVAKHGSGRNVYLVEFVYHSSRD
jgi:hypothetical protein